MTVARKSVRAGAPPSTNASRLRIFTDWTGYLKFLDAIGDGHVKATYNRGTLELRMPSEEHENVKEILGHLLESALSELECEAYPAGSMTFRREDLERGIEPDKCYWIANADAVGGGRAYDPRTDPPPDLVLEVEVTRSIIDRMDIFRTLEVPEIWRWTQRGRLEILILEGGVYRAHRSSKAVPRLSAEQLTTWVHLARKEGFIKVGRMVRAFLRQESS